MSRDLSSFKAEDEKQKFHRAKSQADKLDMEKIIAKRRRQMSPSDPRDTNGETTNQIIIHCREINSDVVNVTLSKEREKGERLKISSKTCMEKMSLGSEEQI